MPSKAEASQSTTAVKPDHSGLSTALVLDSLDALGMRRQAIQCGVIPRTFDRTVVGRAKTLLWVEFAYDDPDTYALELAAVDSIAPGEIVVCATGDSQRSGIWGELLTTAALHRGAAGIVTDGGVRDLAQIRSAGFPVFSRHLSAYDSLNRQKVVAYDVRVEIDGVTIEPGDLIVADCDGIAVVPAASVDAVTAYAAQKALREDGFRLAVQTGMPLVTAFEKYKVL